MTAGVEHPLPETATVAHLAVEALRSLGVDTLFCLPGVQNDDFFDALVDARDIRPVVTRHEQGAAYMALGAAQVTGRPAALCVVPGPGMLNAAAGLTSAYWGNARVLALIGALPSKWRGRGTGILHDLPDPSDVLRQLTKHTDYIGSGLDAVGVWQQAMDELVSGVPRPVAVEVPVDVWGQPADGALEAPRASKPAIDTERIEEAARVLGQARRPLLMVGGGAQDASEPVRELAETLEAPVFARHMGLGVLDTRHRLHAYLTMGRKLWLTSDVVVGIGTRMEFPNVEWGVREGQQVVQVNIDAAELDRYGTGTVGVHGDAAEACRLLVDALGRHNRRREDRTSELAELRARHFERVAHLEPQLSYLRAIRSVMPDDGIIVEDVTQVAFVAHIAYEHRRPRAYLATGGAGTLGAGVAHGMRRRGRGAGAGPAHDRRRRRDAVHRDGAGHRRAARHQHHRAAVRQRRLRQRPAPAAATVRTGPHYRLQPQEPGVGRLRREHGRAYRAGFWPRGAACGAGQVPGSPRTVDGGGRHRRRARSVAAATASPLAPTSKRIRR